MKGKLGEQISAFNMTTTHSNNIWSAMYNNRNCSIVYQQTLAPYFAVVKAKKMADREALIVALMANRDTGKSELICVRIPINNQASS